MRKPDMFEKMVELASWTDEYGCLHLKRSSAIGLLRRQHARVVRLVKRQQKRGDKRAYRLAGDDILGALAKMKKGTP